MVWRVEGNLMFHFRISLKWFLLGTTLVALLIGTAGKQAYDGWQRRHWLARQERIRAQLTLERSGVLMRDGHVAEAHVTPLTGGVQGISLLQGASELQRLILDCPLSDSDVALLARHANLRHLSIQQPNPQMTNESARAIGKLAHLQRLLLGASAINDDGLRYLTPLKELTDVEIGFAPIQGRGLIHLAPLSKLQFISLPGCLVDDEGLAGIAQCKSVQRLSLDRTRIGGSGLAHLAALPNLTHVRLAGITLQDGRGLADLDQVEELDLSEAKIAPGVLTYLAEMDALRSVNLLRAEISNDHLAELKDARQLTHLNLINTNISDVGLLHLRTLTGLKDLKMRFTQVTQRGANQLSTYLPRTDIHFARDKRIVGNPTLELDTPESPLANEKSRLYISE